MNAIGAPEQCNSAKGRDTATMKYDILVRILDRIREEAPPEYAERYLPPSDETERVNYARSRAFIHLYLKVSFGLLEFGEREHFVTDGPFDGGIDGYYISEELRTIYLIQAKYRTTANNFENKPIALSEILVMDVDRILNAHKTDEKGNPYNERIAQLQREVENTPFVGRYSYKVVLLANLDRVTPAKLTQLTGGYGVDVFDCERSYDSLVFPVVSGTYFNASDLCILLDLSTKYAGTKITYSVRTRNSHCDITVLFVPTLEIAKMMSKYKNSILQFNPRSYLDLEGQAVNKAIAETIMNSDTNEFALFNNGITLLSDETDINERIGQRDRAQLTLKNPQIINGGQTSYTLSRIYMENIHNSPESIFAEKEVLLKVITLAKDVNDHDKLELIEQISNATNKQTPVINADRFSNELFHKQLQQMVFQRFGLLYERKRGEFADGLQQGYITQEAIIERNLMLRVYYASNGNLKEGVQKRLFQKNRLSDIDLDNTTALDRFYVGYLAFRRLVEGRNPRQPLDPSIYGKVFAYVLRFFDGSLEVSQETLDENLRNLEAEWAPFLKEMRVQTGMSERKYCRCHTFGRDIARHFGPPVVHSRGKFAKPSTGPITR